MSAIGVRGALLTLVAVLAGCVDAEAQSGWVQGGITLDVRRFSHDAQGSPFDATTPGVSVGAAALIASRWSAGVELDWSGASTTREIVSVALPGGPADLQTTYVSRRRSVTALAGFHSAAGPLRTGAYAGLSFTAFRREISSNAPSVVLQEPPAPSTSIDHVTAPVVGADLAFALSPSLAVLAGVRAEGLRLAGDLSGFSVRPTLGGRVSF